MNPVRLIRSGYASRTNLRSWAAKHTHRPLSTATNSNKLNSDPNEKTIVHYIKRQRARFQTLAYRSLGLTVVAGIAIYLYFDMEKELASKQRAQKNADQNMGKPKIGGPFTLLDTNGSTVRNTDFLGKFMLVYFGFTNCPDICPEELDKMTDMLNQLPSEQSQLIQPIFISVDPNRDSVGAVKQYIQEFHPRLVGLTGSYEMVKATAKAYRVYFSSPPPSTEVTDDYLVDHSIFMYFMDPNGEFVDAFGKNLTVDQLVAKAALHIDQWKQSKASAN